MLIYIGADHGGYKLKESIKKHLVLKRKILVVDVGAHSYNKKDDYPDYARKVAHLVSKNKDSIGILVCGTGTGMVIAANRTKGIRAALAYDKYTAVMSKRDNNANILCLRGRKVNSWHQKKIVDYWLASEFSNLPRHKRRIKEIDSKK